MRRRELVREQARLRNALRGIARDRELLLETADGEDDYRQAVEGQVGRLTSLNLLPDTSNSSGSSHAADRPIQTPLARCVALGLAEPDATVRELRDSLEQLQRQLVGIDEAQPARRWR